MNFSVFKVFFDNCCFFFNSITASALAKDEGDDEDMAEMIAYEINSLSDKIKVLEEKLKVFSLFRRAFLDEITL